MEQRKCPEKGGLFGKLSLGEKKLDGKTFYLDRVKKRSTALLLEAITLFGGKVESFLHKDVSFVVTGSQEELAKQDSNPKTKMTSGEPQTPKRDGVHQNDKKLATPRPLACGSRGKALLEKAIRNNERLQGSGVLTNARSWGVKILFADDVLLYLKQLSRERFDSKSRNSEKVYNKQSSHVVKAAALRSPYLKIEDFSRKYKPLHVHSMSFPSLYYSGRYSPFECPPPPRFDKLTEAEDKKNKENIKVVISTEDKCQTPASCNPSPWRPRKKDVGYCECCHQTYNNQDEHLQSDQHRAFVLEASNYSVVDKLAAAMMPGFNPDPPLQQEEVQNGLIITLVQDICELEHLTDMETEDAVKSLQKQESVFMANMSNFTKIEDDVPNGSPSPESQLPIPNLAEPDVEIWPLTPEIDSNDRALSPVMPVLEIAHEQQPSVDIQDINPLSPCPVNSYIYPDAFPPVLSPQVLDAHIHSSYLDAPLLSPQMFTSHEPNDEVEQDNRSSVHALPSITPDLLGHKVSKKNALEIKGAVCYNISERRSRSLPRLSTTALNSKKRCRSASPDCSLSKRRRTHEIGSYNNNLTKRGQKSEKDKYSLLFENASSRIFQSSPKPVRMRPSYCTVEISTQTFSAFSVPQINLAAPSSKLTNPFPNDKHQNALSSQDSRRSNSLSTSVCIESALIPDVGALASSDSDWDLELISHLGRLSGTAPTSTESNWELDKELLHQPCTWMQDTSYESRLHSVLQPATQTMSVDQSTFSRTVVQIVEVQH